MNQLCVHIELKRSNFSLHVDEKFETGITGIFGHSGAGKTSLLQCISGVETPNKGTIVVNEKPLFSSAVNANVATHKRNIGYVFQEGRLFPHLTVMKNVLYGKRFSKNRASGFDFQSIVAMLEIEHLLHSYPSEISGGERQRVSLARALLSAPDVLLLDEPFSALDQKLRKQIIPFIVKVASYSNIPVLIVSHDLPDILRLTDRLCIMKNGMVTGHGEYYELLKNNDFFTSVSPHEIINTITLEVKELKNADGIVVLNGCGENRKINIVFEPEYCSYSLGDKVKVFLRSNDIVLGSQVLESASFQNQIKGTISQLHGNGSRVLCHINCGFMLIAEISRASVLKMNLHEGKEVYAHFKSLALDTLHI